MKTTKQSILANINRIKELLENDDCNAELFNKMHELRRDTIRFEGLKKNWIRPCSECRKEFKAVESYVNVCFDCKYKVRDV